jgi:hypothetical protein
VLGDGGGDATTALVVEGAALHLEADLKWLDRCEEVLGRSRRDGARDARRSGRDGG